MTLLRQRWLTPLLAVLAAITVVACLLADLPLWARLLARRRVQRSSTR